MKRRKFSVLILIVLGFFVLTTLARYIFNNENISEVNATRFYFVSDILDSEEKQYDFYDWNGKGEYNIEIDLKNYEDELRYSENDINYKVLVETYSDKVTTKTYINEIETNEGTLSGKIKSENKIKLMLTNTDDIITNGYIQLKVSISSTLPYEKTLIGIYNININPNSYDTTLISETDYENLIITTYSYNGDIKIKYDNKKLIVFTDNLENANVTDDGIILKTDTNSNYQIEFIKLSTDKINLGTDIVIET